jgi:ribA/ribD-fused uncharacterized protein
MTTLSELKEHPTATTLNYTFGSETRTLPIDLTKATMKDLKWVGTGFGLKTAKWVSIDKPAIVKLISDAEEKLPDHRDIQFYSANTAYGEFSNFYPHELTYRGKTYPTAEHAFQAAKFDYDGASPQSLEYAEIIRTTPSPAKIFVLARQKKTGGLKWRTDLNETIVAYREKAILRPGWNKERVLIMEEIVRIKFQDPVLRKVLFDTGDRKLIEHTHRDSFWADGGDGTGQNMLGVILMKIRAEL